VGGAKTTLIIPYGGIACQVLFFVIFKINNINFY